MPVSSHVLIVDDDPLMRRLYGAKLTDAGYEVLYAGDGTEGREIARRMHPDLVLMDIRLVGVEDGLATAQRLKNEEPTADIPIIFLTNQDLSIEAERMAKELGADDYIHKSINIEEFVERIKKVIPPKK